MKIHIHGWFGFRNLGDDLLLKKAVQVLGSVPAVSSIEIAAEESGYLASYLENVQTVRFSDRGLSTLFTSAMRNDALVIGPGGLFPHRNPAKVLVYLLVTLWWKALGRKVAYFGLGATAIQDSFSAACWRLIAKVSDAFLTRDADLFDACGIRETEAARPCADLVYLREVDDGDLCGSSDRVAVAFANLFTDGEAGYEEFLDACCSLVERIAAKGRHVDLLSFTAGSDERLNKDISSQLSADEVVAISYEGTLAKASRFGEYSLVLGMRFHSCVLASRAGVSLVAISYAHKTERLISALGLNGGCVRYCKDTQGYYEKAIPMDVERIAGMCDAALSNPASCLPDPKVVRELTARAGDMAGTLRKVLAG